MIVSIYCGVNGHIGEESTRKYNGRPHWPLIPPRFSDNVWEVEDEIIDWLNENTTEYSLAIIGFHSSTTIWSMRPYPWGLLVDIPDDGEALMFKVVWG